MVLDPKSTHSLFRKDKLKYNKCSDAADYPKMLENRFHFSLENSTSRIERRIIKTTIGEDIVLKEKLWEDSVKDSS